MQAIHAIYIGTDDGYFIGLFKDNFNDQLYIQEVNTTSGIYYQYDFDIDTKQRILSSIRLVNNDFFNCTNRIWYNKDNDG